MEEHFAALRPRRSNIITPENSLSLFRQYNQRGLHYHYQGEGEFSEFLSLSGMISAPELNLPHYNILIAQERSRLSPSLFFCYQHFFIISFRHNTTRHPKYNKTKQETHTQHLKVQSKGRERGKDNKNTKVTPPYNPVYPTKNTAKHQWSKAWPHRLAPLHIHKSLFAGGYGSNMFFHTCAV